MPVISPYQIALTGEEEAVLTARARSARGPYRDRLRAQIVLAAAAGRTSTAIAAQVGAHVDTVRKWRRRFAASRLAGLKDAPRSGRPPVFTATDRAEAIALAWTPTGFVDTIRSGTMVYEERTGRGTGSQEVHPGI